MGDIRYSRSYDDALNDPLSFKDKFTKTVADYTESEYYNRAWAFFNADEDGNRILPVKDIYRFYDLKNLLLQEMASGRSSIQVVTSICLILETDL